MTATRRIRAHVGAAARGSGAHLGALVALLIGALVLRGVGADYGLPLALLNPDETSIVPRAWQMTHGEGLDPGWFDYPTLFLYLLAPLQALFDTPSFGAGRAVAVTLGLAGVAATYWLGRRAYGRHAGLAAAAAVAVTTTHVAYSRMAVTDVLMTLLVTAAVALALHARFDLAAIAVGLAASSKYPGALAAVPVAVAAGRQARPLARAAALAFASFALTSPFVLIRAGSALDDIERVQRLAREGWLGFENDPVAPLAYLDRLWDGLGPVLLLAGAGVALAVWRRSRADLILLSFVAVYWAYLMPQAAHFDRYVLPLIPVLAVLAARTPRLALATLLAAIVPLVWSAQDARTLTRTDTRLVADSWFRENVAEGERIAADPSTLPLTGRRVLRLALPGPGLDPDPRRSLAELRRSGVTAILIGGSVTDRVRAAASRYPVETRFYDEVERLPVVYEIAPGGGLVGPWVRLYRLSNPG